jgi:hypothetical protein
MTSSGVLIGDDSAVILAWKKLRVKAEKGPATVESAAFLCYNVSAYEKILASGLSYSRKGDDLP